MTPESRQSGASERVSIVTPFGIRFWDPALESQVSDHLEVVAYPEHSTAQGTRAQPTASGVYAFHHLPGLTRVEYPHQVPSSPPVQRRFVVRVSDPRGRFLPLAFEEDLPLTGVYPSNLPCASPSLRPPGFYLFSAPTREAPSSMAIVRTQLETQVEQAETIGSAPAAFAVLEIAAPGGRTYFGLADRRGCTAVLFPYPSFVAPAGTDASPPPAVSRWPLVIRVRYRPASLRFPQAGPTPDLRSILCQGPAWFTYGNPPRTELNAELVLGEALVLQDRGASSLRIAPAPGSP